MLGIPTLVNIFFLKGGITCTSLPAHLVDLSIPVKHVTILADPGIKFLKTEKMALKKLVSNS